MAFEFIYTPRSYQEPLLSYLLGNGGFRGKRAVSVWHRGSGKDLTLFNAVVTAAIYDRIGVYFYFFPTYAQAKKAIWDTIDNDGRTFLSYIPEQAIAVGRDGKPKLNETELKIDFANGSMLQLIGTDKLDNIRGTNPVGVVISEYQDQNPRGWETIEPRLGINGGWACFAYTPKGHNHGYDLYEFAKREPGWFSQLLTIDDTRGHLGRDIHSFVESLRRRGVDEDFLKQEYWCSFSGAMVGSYYGNYITAAYNEKRITRVPYEPHLPVQTEWDLGLNDHTAIWFSQAVGREKRFIDYYENRQQGLAHYIKLVREKAYVYHRHIMPPDINVTEFSSRTKRIDTARALGLTHITVAPKLKIQEGIEAVRRMLPRCWFDEEKCAAGIIALQEYHKKWDDDLQCFSDTPVHDKHSNAADAFRMGAVCEGTGAPPLTQTFADHHHSIFSDPLTQEHAEHEYSVFGV